MRLAIDETSQLGGKLAGASLLSSPSTGAATESSENPTVFGDFDPVALGLNPAGVNVFNLTTINIPVGVTIRLHASKARNKAAVWPATGNLTIAVRPQETTTSPGGKRYGTT